MTEEREADPAVGRNFRVLRKTADIYSVPDHTGPGAVEARFRVGGCEIRAGRYKTIHLAQLEPRVIVAKFDGDIARRAVADVRHARGAFRVIVTDGAARAYQGVSETESPMIVQRHYGRNAAPVRRSDDAQAKSDDVVEMNYAGAKAI